VVDDFLMTYECSCIIRCFGIVNEITISNTIKKSCSSCFWGYQSLSRFNFESRLSCIEDIVFWSCRSLSSIRIPSSVSTIGKYCFCQCTSLSAVAFESNAQLSWIGVFAAALFVAPSQIPVFAVGRFPWTGRDAFWLCGSLSSIYLPSELHQGNGLALISCSGRDQFEADLQFKARNT
jgi:hypothetical protein